MTSERTPEQIIGHDAYMQLVFEGYAVTRAVPDVPELVRYAPEYDYDFRGVITAYMKPNAEGKYVLHSQAAAVVAAKDAENSGLKSLLHENGTPRFNAACRRAEAAEAELRDLKHSIRIRSSSEELATVAMRDRLEIVAAELHDTRAELAQIKAQEPVAYRFRHSEQERWHYGETDQSWWEHQPLYVSPVSDRLRVESAKLAKYCEWYDGVDELGSFPDIQDAMVPLGDLRALRAALNVEASDDKG